MAAKIKPGDLIRIPVGCNKNAVIPVYHYLYGTVLETKYPMKDDDNWADHLIQWHDGSGPSWEWEGEIEWVADE